MDHERNAAGRAQVVEHQPQSFSEHRARHADALGRAAAGHGMLERDRARVEPAEHGGEIPAEVGKRALTRVVGRAVRDDVIERRLCPRGEGQRQLLGRRADTEKRQRADPRRVLTQILQRGERAIRHAVEVDRRIAETATHLVEVVHRDRRRVEPEIGDRLQRLAARANLVGRQQISEVALGARIAVDEPADEPVRRASATLIHEHDVPCPAHPREVVDDARGHLAGCAPARTAGEDEDRIRGGCRAQGR